MQLITSLAVVSTIAATALAGSASVVNKCNHDIFLTISEPNKASTQHTIKAGAKFTQPVVGSGNSWGLTNNANYYSASTPKLIWGWSDSSNTVYYSVNTVDGNPYSKFSLNTNDSKCSNVNSPDARTRTCPSSADFTLTTC